MFFLDKARKGSWAVVFTCASGWNGCRRASCTMQNRLSITQPHFHLAKHHPIRKHYTHSFSTENRMMQSEHSPHRTTTHTLHQSLRALLTAGIALALLAGVGVAQAKGPTGDKPHATKTSPKKKSVSKVTYQRSTSEETTAERDRRMFRECRGLHNAGACRGYTRK